VKGSIVIHLLRHIVGDDDFYRAIAHYLKSHAFGEVESADLLAAFERTTGRDLSWFFDDWITGGGGHPSIKAAYLWVPDRGQIDLMLEQVQADQPFENLFRLPIDVTIATATGSSTHTVWMNDWETRISLPADGRPLAVNVDAGNWLVADIAIEQGLDEVIYLLENGDLAARLRAARQIATDYPRRPEGIAALGRALANRERHWGLRQEAAVDLGSSGQPAAIDALLAASADPDRRVRRAVAVALGEAGGPLSARALRTLIENDSAEDVIGAAAASLGRMHAEGAARFLQQQLRRDSRWWNAIRIGALIGLAELEDPSLVPTFREYVIPRYQRQVRLAALDGWFRAAPEDPALAAELRRMTRDRNGNVRSDSLEKLGHLHRNQDLDFLEKYATEEPDPNLSQSARDAIEEIEEFTGK
jgi:aminopeptidase N